MRTQVGIIGAGPAGLTLALLLQRAGIESVVLEARDRAYVEKRVRAGLLEYNTVELMQQLGVAERLDREGLRHRGVYLRRPGWTRHIDIEALTGRPLTIYGQQEVVKDLIAACEARGVDVRFEVAGVEIEAVEEPVLGFAGGRLRCDFIAGCDGFHGVSRSGLAERTDYDLQYHFDWLGILAHAAPATEELIYAWHERGFALYSMRSEEVSRLYIQVPRGEAIESWPDERIWKELQIRLARDGWEVGEGPILEKGITAMRSYVCTPMQHGNLYLAGDAAHIVPPTGAKGLNLAVSDVRHLSAALIDFYATGRRDRLDAYTATALRRVWRAQEFSNWMTMTLHQLGEGPYMEQLQLSRLEHLDVSEAAERTFAENYVGLPATDGF